MQVEQNCAHTSCCLLFVVVVVVCWLCVFASVFIMASFVCLSVYLFMCSHRCSQTGGGGIDPLSAPTAPWTKRCRGESARPLSVARHTSVVRAFPFIISFIGSFPLLCSHMYICSYVCFVLFVYLFVCLCLSCCCVCTAVWRSLPWTRNSVPLAQCTAATDSATTDTLTPTTMNGER